MHMFAIRKFLDDHQEKISKGMTTSDFNRGIVKDKTKGTNAPFIDLYKDEMDIKTGKPLVAPATVFVSHAWKYPFVEVVVDVMEQYNKRNPDTYFWFDLFTNDQNAKDKKDADCYSTTFREISRALVPSC